MPNNYHISLKGEVGGWDFNRGQVDDVLNEMKDTHVDVIIESLGGQLATGIAISNSFRNHGDVSVHFTGLNASAATIASLGAKHISIDKTAAYLVHKVSMEFFQWASVNADAIEDLLKDLEEMKEDLNKLDSIVAEMYAQRCKRPAKDLLELMKRGGWLTAQEALDWGFVDEITDWGEPAAKLTNSVANQMTAAGMPLPNMPVTGKPFGSSLKKFINSVMDLITPTKSKISDTMEKSFTHICALLSMTAVAFTDDKASLTEDQFSAIEEELDKRANRISDLEGEVAELKDKLDKLPAAASSQVIEDTKAGVSDTALDDYAKTMKAANELFNQL